MVSALITSKLAYFNGGLHWLNDHFTSGAGILQKDMDLIGSGAAEQAGNFPEVQITPGKTDELTKHSAVYPTVTSLY